MSYIMVRGVDSGCFFKGSAVCCGSMVARHKRFSFLYFLQSCFMVEDDLTDFQSYLESDSCG